MYIVYRCMTPLLICSFISPVSLSLIIRLQMTIFTTLFSETMISREMKLGMHLDCGYRVYQNHNAAAYLFLSFSVCVCLSPIFRLQMKISATLFSATLNRKEGNDQESVQLPNTFRSKAPKRKKDALIVMAPQSEHYKQKAKRTVLHTWTGVDVSSVPKS